MLEEEDNSTDLLGLRTEDPEGPGPAKKRRTSQGGPKLKKSREEIFAEEVDKIRGRYQELVNSMQEAGSPMPTVAGVSKLQRSVAAKKTEAKDHGSFEASTALDELDTALQNFKEALRVCALFLPPNGHPRKNHQDSFVVALQGLSLGVREKFPEAILGHYRHLCHLKDTQGHVSARNDNCHFFALVFLSNNTQLSIQFAHPTTISHHFMTCGEKLAAK